MTIKTLIEISYAAFSYFRENRMGGITLLDVIEVRPS